MIPISGYHLTFRRFVACSYCTISVRSNLCVCVCVCVGGVGGGDPTDEGDLVYIGGVVQSFCIIKGL